VEAAGAASLRHGDVTVLGREIIHSVTNPLDKLSYALHVYDGDFLAAEGKSCWHAQTLGELPYDGPTVSPMFGQAVLLRTGTTPSGVEIRGHLRRMVRRIRSHWPGGQRGCGSPGGTDRGPCARAFQADDVSGKYQVWQWEPQSALRVDFFCLELRDTGQRVIDNPDQLAQPIGCQFIPGRIRHDNLCRRVQQHRRSRSLAHHILSCE
jgi:hypothetical protein